LVKKIPEKLTQILEKKITSDLRKMIKRGRKVQKYPAKVNENSCVFTVVTPARHSRLVDREDAVQLTGLRKQPKKRGRNHVSQYRRERTTRPS